MTSQELMQYLEIAKQAVENKIRSLKKDSDTNYYNSLTAIYGKIDDTIYELNVADQLKGHSNMTIFQLLTENGITPNTKILNDLGMMIAAFAKAKGIAVTRVEQREGDKVCMVNSYPQGFEFVMKQIVQNYFAGLELDESEPKTEKE